MKPTDSLQPIIIYTDGSSLGNPGPGGYGCVLVFQGTEEVFELGGYAKETTNNKMELTAIKTVLEFLMHKKVSPTTPIVIHTDSSYAINGITKWTAGWQRKGWVTMQKTSVLNVELWKPIAELKKLFPKISFVHVRGHAGVWGNERCDIIATSFASGEKPKLYHGKLGGYDTRILSSEVTTTPSQKSSGSRKSGAAYSYVAQVNGKIYTFEDWESCKAAVHGRSSKYKKVFSKDEEEKLKKEWS
jgi:ribonuclease HI